MSVGEILLVAPPPVAARAAASFGAAPAATALAALLPTLAQDICVRLLLDAPNRLGWAPPPGVDVVGTEDYAASTALQALPHVCELGDHPTHRLALRMARRGGGLLVLNDISLHGLVEAETLGIGDRAGYLAACTAEGGAAGATLARGRLRGLDIAHRRAMLPLTAPLLAAAHGVLVHGPEAAARLRAPAGLRVHIGCRAVDVATVAQDSLDRVAARDALGLRADAVVLVVAAGSADPMGAISVLRVLRQRHPTACLVSDGPCPALARQAEMRGCEAVVRAGPDTILAGRAAADIVLAIDPIAMGAVDATMDAGLAIGLPVVGFRHGAAGMLPRPLALCVPYADNAATSLAAAVSELLRMATRGGFIAGEARSYMRQQRSAERAARSYLRGIHAMTAH